mmetsp:Transcript_70336/g.164793  ORF Transcript_70336/g.164793 Transcript_70336/m.164793 type:complete len:98 (-) Transcript_70336:211-504(-)
MELLSRFRVIVDIGCWFDVLAQACDALAPLTSAVLQTPLQTLTLIPFQENLLTRSLGGLTMATIFCQSCLAGLGNSLAESRLTCQNPRKQLCLMKCV